FATVASGVPTWLFTDNLGSVREVVSLSGTVLDQITYGAFGNILSQTNSSNAPRFLYAGGEWDGNLGLYHFGARWDDPVDGRWISQDQLGLGPDADPYRYVENSPANSTDPTGLIPTLGMPRNRQLIQLQLLKAEVALLTRRINRLIAQIAARYVGIGAQMATLPPVIDRDVWYRNQWRHLILPL